MRPWLAALVLFVSLIGCRSVEAGASPVEAAKNPLAELQDLNKWVGKYPHEKIDGKTAWENKVLYDLAALILAPQTMDMLFKELAFGVTSPVEKEGDVIRMQACREHACILNSATLFIDLKKTQLSICWRNVHDKHDAWLENGQEPEFKKVGACDEYQGFELYKKFYKE